MDINTMKNILMCGSSLAVKGGMVSVVKNYLEYDGWDDYRILYVPTHIEKNKYALMLFFGVAYIKIIFFILTRHIDIAHLHMAERGSFYRKAFLVRTLNFFGIKTILHHHGAEFEPFYESLSDKQKKYVSDILEKADLNIVLSRRLVSMIADKAPAAKIEVLYNAVPVYEHNPFNMNAKNILFLGRLGKRKGVYDFLDALLILDSRMNEDVKVYLCGDGDVEAVMAKVAQMGLEHRIAHIGWIDSAKREAFMKNTMINVLPSYNEGLPMTILETMAYGIPNISTKIASIPEVINDGVNGFMITPGDIESLVDRIGMLVSDSLLRRKFSDDAYNFITDNFSLKNNIGHLKKIYGDML